MADLKDNGMNDDQTEKKMSDYEELLDGFSGDDESREGQDGIALSELLDGIDAQDDSGEDIDDIVKDLDEINIDAIDELNIDDFGEESPGEAAPEEPAKKTTSGTFDIDVDADGDDGLGGYSSVLNELNGEKVEVPGEPGDEAGSGELLTQEIPVLEDIEPSEEVIEDTGNIDEEIPEIEPDEELVNETVSYGDILGEDIPEDSEVLLKPSTQEIPAFADDKTTEDILAEFTQEPDETVEPETVEPDADVAGEETEESADLHDLDIPVLDEIDYNEEMAPEEVDEHEGISGLDFEENTMAVDSDVSYGEMLDDDVVGDFDDTEDAKDEQDITLPETSDESDIEEIAVETSAVDTGENLSYASMLDEPLVSEALNSGNGEIEERRPVDSLAEEEFSLDELTTEEDAGELPIGEELSGEEESGDMSSFGDFMSSSESDDEEFVISGADDSDDDENFLKLHDEENGAGGGEEDLIPGVADVSSTLNTEVKIEGFDMDVEEQIRAVTRAELLLAQGKTGEASDVFVQIVENQGLHPWVAKRCVELGVELPGAAVEAEDEETVE